MKRVDDALSRIQEVKDKNKTEIEIMSDEE